MNKIFKEMIEWDAVRGNTFFDKENESKMLLSEANEFVDAKSEHEEVDGLADTIKVAASAIYKKGYDIELVLKEMLKEISSRTQDPAQKEVWDKWGASGKWEKDKRQDKKTLYVANYYSCKILKD